ncbi:hypothetical protein DRJ04_04140 [Candidatus Aerophobetes bacterium]|uniref:TRAP C4-dicarboxylate transport system permease DctM subunit domain-containing protein n=1 Tax=Aerophobetes bacterium TaxID=2030807 RepID=A0A662DHC4_UNCAE|nr:MAG: hypothetical protein DRJ04_04140 [Candidatus Aerophobetes bacterium]
MCSIIPVSFLGRGSRMTPKRIICTLETGAKNAIMIAVACTCAGMIVTVVTHTGLGLAFSTIALTLSHGKLFLVLLMVMVSALILGTGVPSTAAYILASTLGVPVLVKLGVDLLAAHLFTYYFVILACCTPPVAVCAYAGAAIAGSEPMKTGFQAFKLALAGFIVPYMYVYNPVLILRGPMEKIIIAAVTALIGVIVLAAGLEDHFLTKTNIFERILLVGGGVALIAPKLQVSLLGGCLVGICVIIQVIKRKKEIFLAQKKAFYFGGIFLRQGGKRCQK